MSYGRNLGLRHPDWVLDGRIGFVVRRIMNGLCCGPDIRPEQPVSKDFRTVTTRVLASSVPC